jgi:DNA primase
LEVGVSGPIPEEIIADILRRTNIVDVIGEHLPLRKMGSGYQGLCPFHTDSKPSFNVNAARQFFHCFGCGAGGNAYHFLMRMHQMTFPEAVRLLAARSGIDLPERTLTPEERRKSAEREELLEINEKAAEFFRNSLTGPEGREARAYLENRGIPAAMQEAFGLGFAPAGWEGLVGHLRSFSVPLPKADHAGLVIRRKEGGYYDRFRGRTIFPIHDEAGRVVGFGGRSLGDDLPKYINSPDSPIFAKRRNVYGLHKAKGAIREMDEVVVVEGYTDLLALHQFGVCHSVATLGTALTADHLRILRRFSSNVIHLFDSDEAGERATVRAVDLCLDAGVWGRVLRFPKGHDPDSYVREVGGEALGKELKKSSPLLDYWIGKTISQGDVSRLDSKLQMLEEILPKIRKLRHQVAVDHYVSLIAESLRISEERIREMLRTGVRKAKKSSEESAPDDAHQAERLLLLSVLKDPSLAKCLQMDVLERFQNPAARALGDHIARCAETGEFELRCLEARVQEPEMAEALASLLTRLEEVRDPERVCEDCLKHLRRKGIDREIQTLEERIVKARSQMNEERVRALQEEKAALVLQKARMRMSA